MPCPATHSICRNSHAAMVHVQRGHFVCTSQTGDNETEQKRQLHRRKVFTFFMYRVFFKIENGLITDVKETANQAFRI